MNQDNFPRYNQATEYLRSTFEIIREIMIRELQHKKEKLRR